MRSRVKLLSLTVWITVSLLIIGATLVVLGIFNSALKWDIFSPQVEAVLYGIFGASVALSTFGVAITFVLGIQEIVKAVASLRPSQERDASGAIAPEARRRTYAAYMGGLVAVFSALIGFLSLINYQIQVHRNQVFKRIASEQIQSLNSKFVQQIAPLKTPPRNKVPITLEDLIQNVNKLSFVERLTLYVPDPNDNSVIWSYTSWGNYNNQNGFARLIVSKDFEKAIKQALQGDSKLLNALNNRTDFKWYYVVRNQQGKPLGVLRVDGNQRENFREYSLGSRS